MVEHDYAGLKDGQDLNYKHPYLRRILEAFKNPVYPFILHNLVQNPMIASMPTPKECVNV